MVDQFLVIALTAATLVFDILLPGNFTRAVQ